MKLTEKMLEQLAIARITKQNAKGEFDGFIRIDEAKEIYRDWPKLC